MSEKGCRVAMDDKQRDGGGWEVTKLMRMRSGVSFQCFAVSMKDDLINKYD